MMVENNMLHPSMSDEGLLDALGRLKGNNNKNNNNPNVMTTRCLSFVMSFSIS